MHRHDDGKLLSSHITLTALCRETKDCYDEAATKIESSPFCEKRWLSLCASVQLDIRKTWRNQAIKDGTQTQTNTATQSLRLRIYRKIMVIYANYFLLSVTTG